MVDIMIILTYPVVNQAEACGPEDGEPYMAVVKFALMINFNSDIR